ncbi:hypothetical protein [Vibrio alginolyticus]|uniref:hypothetical protein n=1 Tax=Vibrio alginolyticus TaxID=663 RepID=UPI0022AB28C8|nr:hypothetical protein [Vibrio alginolyticus]MCZ2798994.1 hypothetical protein [Vibrio alginolyticus]
MITEDQIRARIKELEADERHSYAPANVFSNAPLAIIQTSITSELNGLYFALGEVPPNQQNRREVVNGN